MYNLGLPATIVEKWKVACKNRAEGIKDRCEAGEEPTIKPYPPPDGVKDPYAEPQS
jgi:hypothetical protein